MTSPLTDAISTQGHTGIDTHTTRRRVEAALETLAPTGAMPDEREASEAFERDGLVAPLQRVNEVIRPYGVEFELDEGTSRTVTRLVDRENGEVIRQIPAEEMLRVAERIEELQGVLIQQQA
ncbi:flagellar protein FlaG [Halomonas elongata]|uniref:FlaG family protein n=1 Tax=Halomonas elongata (strain ATCC 33173 / DSM 2581 / NBRC 15536 / NCIMB 2198 / 1H9) TaxID=768066 RepID=E1VBT4_HALED|nr:flagellar protein FlaG [Halomonas elongata]WBF18007.1 flagellar protein FlaG [Halomonas elongata]WPU46856.1 flagellar protein FlaG [Halomonas elongata DSM 2581]CBV44241.1 FlaG family protein [Halomonas elongata DSM 2581]